MPAGGRGVNPGGFSHNSSTLHKTGEGGTSRFGAQMYIRCFLLYNWGMSHYAASRAREVFSEVVDKSATEAVFIERRGEVAAVVISPSRYEQLLEALEDLEDERAFDEALADEGESIPWEQVKADLGWQ